MALPFTDHFTNGGVDQDIEVYNSSYVRKIDLTITMQVHNNEVRSKIGNTSPTIGYDGGGTSYTANQSIEARIAGSQVNYVSLGVRIDGDATLFSCQGYAWAVWAGSFVYYLVGGAVVGVPSSPSITIPSLGDICKFVVEGSQLRAYINGSLAATYDDTTPVGPASGGIPCLTTGAPVSLDGWDDATWDNYPSAPPVDTSGAKIIFRNELYV